MGEVYRALDTRLDRQVAIKLLPAEFSQNAQLRVRFEREAKAISGLTHPHICTLYDVGHENGRDFLVLELLEGESLADRLAKGPLPIEQAIRVGAQVAEALEKAHKHGIVHRDLKPGNVMLTKSGAKLLDFGLAKSALPLTSPDAATFAMQEATQQRPLTQEGTIVGTFQYMAPEQLEGRDVDARTDIFALGAVLYEMATGRRAFDGKSRASVIATILERDPAPISSLQPMTPPAFERVVQHCLRKDPDERWQSAHDVAEELKWIAEGGSGVGLATPVLARRKRRELAWMLAALVFALTAAALGVALSRRTTPAATREIRSEIPPPPGHDLDVLLDSAGSVTISPDGRWITFAAIEMATGDRKLWLRPIDSLQARPLDAAVNAQYPFWSPDSRTLAYFSDGKLKRVDIAGGPATLVTEGLEPRGGAWSPNGTIIFTPHWRGPLSRVSANGGKPEPLTTLDEKLSETTHRYPVFLPDGEHFLYLAGTHLADEKSELNAVYLGSLQSKERTLLLRARSNVIYAAGHLLFVRDHYLLAQPFDPVKRKLVGEPRRIADSVHYESGFFRAAFGAADDGTVVFAPPGATLMAKLQWRDRTGKGTDIPGEPALWRSVSLSPDGNYVAAEISDPADLWILDVNRGTRRRLTSHPLNEIGPLWSPDGRTIIYSSDRKVVFDVFSRPSDGSGAETTLIESPDLKIATSWSSDGRLVLVDRAKLSAALFGDIWVMPMTGDRKPYPLLHSEFGESRGAFSPDGRWISFIGDETGRPEVYVTAFPTPGARQQISTAGADWRTPMWRADGKELFYVQRDGMLMSVAVNATATSVEAAAPQPLFRVSRLTEVSASRDGQRFVATSRSDAATPPLTLVTGWNGVSSSR